MGGVGNDAVTIDSSNGLFATPTNNTDGIFFNGGSGFDKLVLQQTGGDEQTTDVYTVGPNPGEGSDVITGLSGTQSVFFQNLAPVLDFVPVSNLTVDGTPADNAINYGPGVVNPVADGLVTIDNFESYEFSNKTNLVINGLAGSDTINLNNPNMPTGLTSITVNGDDPTGPANLGNTLIANGTTAADAINFTPAAADGGTIAGAGPVNITFATIEQVVINGQGGNDTLTVTTPAAAEEITYTAGARVDSGTVQAGSLVPLSFTNLGTGGSVTFTKTGGGTGDTLVYNGSRRQ